MDQPANIWTPHLKPDERLVWSASVSPALIRAETSRRRLTAALIGGASLILAGAFGWKLYETFFVPEAQPTLSAGIAGPLYIALALTFAVVAIAQLGRFKAVRPAAARYAATSIRLIAADVSGAIVDEVDVQDIAGLILGGRRSAPDLFALRRHDDANVRAFAIEHIDNPLEAKAMIEDQLLEHAP
jgi:hypothetical protein